MVNGALLMAQIAGLNLHDNWETDQDDAHNEHQPIHENVEDSNNKPWTPNPTRCSLSGLSSSNSDREIVIILRLPVVPSLCSQHHERPFILVPLTAFYNKNANKHAAYSNANAIILLLLQQLFRQASCDTQICAQSNQLTQLRRSNHAKSGPTGGSNWWNYKP